MATPTLPVDQDRDDCKRHEVSHEVPLCNPHGSSSGDRSRPVLIVVPADHCWCRRRNCCSVLERTAPDGSRVQTEILTSDERSPNLLPAPTTRPVGNVRDCSAPSPDCYSDNWYIPASAAPDGRPISCIRSFRRLNRSRAHDHHEAHTSLDHCPERSLLAVRIYETEDAHQNRLAFASRADRVPCNRQLWRSPVKRDCCFKINRAVSSVDH